jgi:hypothetical protein
MRFFRSFLPNLTISLNLVLMIVIYLDMRNPMMGFLIGTPFVVLVASCCICSIATAVVLYAAYRKAKRKFLDKLQEKE